MKTKSLVLAMATMLALGVIALGSLAAAGTCSHSCAESIGCSGGCSLSSACGAACWGGGCSYHCRELGGPGCTFDVSGSCDRTPPPRAGGIEDPESAAVGYQWAFVRYDAGLRPRDVGATAEVIASSSDRFAAQAIDQLVADARRWSDTGSDAALGGERIYLTVGRGRGQRCVRVVATVEQTDWSVELKEDRHLLFVAKTDGAGRIVSLDVVGPADGVSGLLADRLRQHVRIEAADGARRSLTVAGIARFRKDGVPDLAFGSGVEVQPVAPGKEE